MTDYGLTDDGIESPAYNEIISFLAQKWKEEFGQEADLSSRAPEGHFLRTMALMFSNKGMEWSDIESLWDVALDLYYSAYVGTANGVSLDHAVDRRGLTRGSAESATGILVFSGDSGETIPLNTTATTNVGTEFITTREAEIGPHGVVSVPAKAVESGTSGNVVAGTITDTGNYQVNNPVSSHVRVLGSTKDVWEPIPNDNSLNKYQLLDPKDIKYITNLNELSLHIKSNDSGLYAFKLILMNHSSGQRVYQTETNEVTLEANTENDVSFKGQGFDLGDVKIDDNLRIAVQNQDYSVGDLDVALDDNPSSLRWHEGTTELDKSLVISLKSEVKGHFTGGKSAETDQELRTRYQKELDRGGRNRVAVIESELHEISGLKHAKVYENSTHHDKRDGGGLPPHSIEAVTWGGNKQEIMRVLLSEKSAGTNTWGERVGTITDEEGQVHRMSWSRAEEVSLYIDIRVVTGANFPADGAKRIKNICADIVGGENTDGAFQNGVIGVGETVYQSGIESALHENINGLHSVNTTLGTDPDHLTDSNVQIDAKQTAVVSPSTINIIE